MDSLEEKKRANHQIEQNQIKLVSKFLEQQRKRFDYADTAHWILENKNETDLIFISEKVNEWHSMAKESNKAQFLEIIMALFRIQSYCSTIQTIAKGSVAEYSNEVKRSQKLENELYHLKLEISNLKAKYESEIKSLNAQLEFSSNNK
jgi:hypothetical protein